MSLYLPEQKLGSHSQPDSTSHKFMLKGRQTGSMHRGHAWVFRAESHDTMMAWYDDIENLINKTGEARNAFVRRHMRAVSTGSFKASSISSDGVMDEDEADRTPYSADSVVLSQEPPATTDTQWSRPQPGGRFPSDVQIDRHLHAPLSPSSGDSSGDREALVAAGQPVPGHQENEANRINKPADGDLAPLERHSSYYGEWINNSVTAVGGAANVAAAQKQQQTTAQQDNINTQHPEERPALPNRKSTSDARIAALHIGGDSPADSIKTQPNRLESASTVPTSTNFTDHTTNTAPTSIDTTTGGDMTPSSIAVGTYRKLKREESLRKADRTRSSSPGAASSTIASTATSPISTTGPTLTSVSTSHLPQRGSTDLTSAKSKDSVSTIELKIPGRYPPNSIGNSNSNSNSTSTT